jgi:hypothetical protein
MDPLLLGYLKIVLGLKHFSPAQLIKEQILGLYGEDTCVESRWLLDGI